MSVRYGCCAHCSYVRTLRECPALSEGHLTPCPGAAGHLCPAGMVRVWSRSDLQEFLRCGDLPVIASGGF